MTFLGLAFLAALPLAAAPILLHLFDRRRTVVIEWGAMQFLMEASSRKTSARRFQHWLLLLLRVLAIAALVLALARPLVELSWFPSYDATETVLVIDTSLSTMQRHAEATAFDELMQRSTAKVRELASGSAIRILVTSPYPAWATPASVRLNDATRDELVALITTLRPTEGTGDIPAALLKAVQSESESDRVGSRELVVLTDGQRVDWQAENIPAWQQFQAAWQAAPLPTSLEIVQLRASADSTGNLAIADMRIQGATTGPGQPFTVTAQLHNFAREASAPTTIEWLLGEERLTTTEVPSIGAGATHEVRWQHALDGSGVYAVGCRLLSEDALAADNRESRILEVVDRVPVLLVEDASGYTEIQQDTYLIRAALGHIEGETRDGWHAVFEPRTVAPDQLDTIRLEDFRVVVIPNLTALADEVVARLEQFVSGGGGLWLALGPRTDRDVFDRQWFREGAGLVPLRLGRIVDEPTDPLLQPTINPFLKAHPATAQLANYHQLDLGDVKVSRRYRFSPADGATPVPVLLELSNGDPLAVEHRVGLGRVIVQAVPLRLQWSDLAVAQAFVVMIHDWLGYLSEPGGTRYNLRPGDALLFRTGQSGDPHATLTSPDGRIIPVTSEPVDSETWFRTSHTHWPGNYSVEYGLAGRRIPFHVIRDARESDLTQLSAADLAAIDTVAALRRGVQDAFADTHRRTRIWPVLILTLLALIAGELVLSGVVARRRFGGTPIPETTTSLASLSPREQPAAYFRPAGDRSSEAAYVSPWSASREP